MGVASSLFSYASFLFSHPGHSLKLKNYTKPYTCSGCKELGFGSRYRCDSCDYELHEACMSPPETTTHDFFRNAAFNFLREPQNPKCSKKNCGIECKRYCNACGKAVNGFGYRCAARDLNFHPCCLNLETKMDIGGEEVRLQKKVSRPCLWCRKKKLEDRGSGAQDWAYASSNEGYCIHVRCVTEMMLEAWQTDGSIGSDDDVKSVASVMSKMKLQLQRNSKGNRGRGNKYSKMLKSALRIIMCALLGDPTMTLACVVTEALLS